MPIHDWTRVPPGIFHHFHGTWIFELAKELNQGRLPAGYYALGEQVVTGAVPDVLTLERPVGVRTGPSGPAAEPTALSSEPTATITAEAPEPRYPPRSRVLAIRHVSGDRVVAIVEIVSPGNKREAAELGGFIEKTVATLSKGVHVVVVGLHPPGSFDPDGLHNVIWRELGQAPTTFDPARPLAVVSYVSDGGLKAYMEPLAVGEALPEIPLFLSPDRHVALPLEASYSAAFAAMPAHLRSVLGEEANR